MVIYYIKNLTKVKMTEAKYTTKIYKITNDVSGKFYIGSTKQRLSNRLAGHRTNAKKNKQNPLYCDMRDCGFEHFTITLIKTIEINSY